MVGRDSAPGRTAGGGVGERQRCPFLQHCAARGYPLLGYCQAYRDGRLRAVTISEFRDYCTGPGHRTCPSYEVRIAQEAADAA